jgi:hypothetical protein
LDYDQSSWESDDWVKENVICRCCSSSSIGKKKCIIIYCVFFHFFLHIKKVEKRLIEQLEARNDRSRKVSHIRLVESFTVRFCCFGLVLSVLDDSCCDESVENQSESRCSSIDQTTSEIGVWSIARVSIGRRCMVA